LRFAIFLTCSIAMAQTDTNPHPIPTTVVVVPTTERTAPNYDEYYRRSASDCPLHQSCSCCTCRCCALFILIVWIVIGAIGIYNSSISLELFEDAVTDPGCQTYNTNYEQISGPTIDVDCCLVEMDSVSAIAVPGDCKAVESVLILSLVDNILCCVAGILGLIALVSFISYLLYIPMAVALIDVVFAIAGLAILGLGFGTLVVGQAFISIGIAILVVMLFYQNRVIMKQTLYTYSSVNTHPT